MLETSTDESVSVVVVVGMLWKPKNLRSIMLRARPPSASHESESVKMRRVRSSPRHGREYDLLRKSVAPDLAIPSSSSAAAAEIVCVGVS